MNTKCQLHNCTARADGRLLGVRVCWLHRLRIKATAALTRQRSHDLAA